MSDVIEVWRDHANDPKARDGYAHIPTSDLRVIMDRLTTAERERDEARRALGMWKHTAKQLQRGLDAVCIEVEKHRSRADTAERERDGWKHRTERAERVVEAAQVQCEAHGVWVQCGCTDFHCLHFSAYQGKCAVTEGAVRALDTTPSQEDACPS